MRLVDDARRTGQEKEHVRELEITREHDGAPPQGGKRGQGGAGQKGRARQREGAAPVQDLQTAHVQARMGSDAVQGEDLGGGPRIALTHQQRRVRSGRAQGRGRLHDLHAARALEGKADVGRH